MSNIRVAAVTFDWYPFDPLVRRTAGAAIDGGYSVDVICLRQPGELRYEICEGVRVHRLPMNRGFGRSLPLTIMSWCWFLFMSSIVLARLHIQKRIDVVHVHNMPDFLVFSALIPKLLGAKVILEIQDVSPELMGAKAKGKIRKIVVRLARWQERISTAYADHVITVGWPFEQLLLQRGVPAEKITIILNSADPKLFPASRSNVREKRVFNASNPMILMYHGTVASRNGLDIAVRALAKARQEVPHIRLDIKGRGEFIPLLKQLAQKLGVGEYLVFSEPCQPEELVDFVTHGDVGIIPYRNDGFMELVLPTKAYEFAWMHRPMIASNTHAIRSMFRPESIALCDDSSPDSFAEAIIELYQDPEKRMTLAINAADDYSPFKWEAMSERYRILLRTLSKKEVQKESRTTVSRL
ncbi:MAG: glycosyltransferase family 4 protein [Ktedonobacteraceae bacterium]